VDAVELGWAQAAWYGSLSGRVWLTGVPHAGLASRLRWTGCGAMAADGGAFGLCGCACLGADGWGYGV
jgi:hypothetical protein